jgi:hypothetical protein
MPFCKICGEYHPDNEMSVEDICIYCENTIIHNNHENENDDNVQENS